MLVDALRDERMGDLHQERARSGAEQQRRLAVEPPGPLGAVEARRPRTPRRSRRRQRSSARSPWRVLRPRHPPLTGRIVEGHRARWGADFDPDRLAVLELRMWKAYYRRQPARLFGTARPRTARAGACVVAAGAPRGALPDQGRRRVRPGDRRLRAVRPGRRARATGARAAAMTSTSTRSPARSCAGGSSAARSAWRPVRRPATTITRLYAALYASRWSRSRRRAGCAGSPPRSAIAARRTIPTARTGPGGAYWPEVARLLRESYRSLSAAVGLSA